MPYEQRWDAVNDPPFGTIREPSARFDAATGAPYEMVATNQPPGTVGRHKIDLESCTRFGNAALS